MTPKLRPLTREAISRIDDLRRASAEHGVRFGDSLVEAFGWQWSVAERDGRNDIVVHDGKGGWMVWPRDVVGKRYVSRETGFMTALRDELAAQR